MQQECLAEILICQYAFSIRVAFFKTCTEVLEILIQIRLAEISLCQIKTRIKDAYIENLHWNLRKFAIQKYLEENTDLPESHLVLSACNGTCTEVFGNSRSKEKRRQKFLICQLSSLIANIKTCIEVFGDSKSKYVWLKFSNCQLLPQIKDAKILKTRVEKLWKFLIQIYLAEKLIAKSRLISELHISKHSTSQHAMHRT